MTLVGRGSHRQQAFPKDARKVETNIPKDGVTRR
jgi:hypothetical protein